MDQNKRILFAVSVLFLSILASAQQVSKSLSLQDCIFIALKNNLGVQIAVLSPELASANINLSKEKFLPRLSLGFNRQSTSSASYSWIEAAETIKSSTNDFSAGIWQALPSGGGISLSLASYKSESNRSFQTINPRYGSTLSFGLSQPLLRNFGTKMSRREIVIARNNLDISENYLKSVLLDTIFNVEQAYWNLIYAVENLNVKKQSLGLAKDLLSKNKRELEVGMIAPIEILSAEAEVATREADILQAEVMVENSEDLLKTTINIEREEKSRLLRIIPLDEPSEEARIVSLDEALKTAIANRPDLEMTKIGLKNKELNVAYAKNQILPDLNLTASYWSPGISGTQILYLDNNPLTGQVIGTIPGGPSTAMGDALGLKYSNWSIGVQVSVPISAFTSRAQYEASKLGFEQALIERDHLEQKIFLEIRTAVRAAETNYRRVLAYRAARELADKKLVAEEKKLIVGLTTNYLVLQYQRDLADARTAELKALIEYNLALAFLEKALGTSLMSKGINFSEVRRGDGE